MMRRTAAILALLLVTFANGCSNARSQTVSHAPIQPVQVKACEVAATWYTLSCTFDASVTAGGGFDRRRRRDGLLELQLRFCFRQPGQWAGTLMVTG